MIEITSDYGIIGPLRWFNSRQGIDLTKEAFHSPCDRILFARVSKQSGPVTYWGCVDVISELRVNSIQWCTNSPDPLIKASGGARIHLGSGARIRGVRG